MSCELKEGEKRHENKTKTHLDHMNLYNQLYGKDRVYNTVASTALIDASVQRLAIVATLVVTKSLMFSRQGSGCSSLLIITYLSPTSNVKLTQAFISKSFLDVSNFAGIV